MSRRDHLPPFPAELVQDLLVTDVRLCIEDVPILERPRRIASSRSHP